MCLKDKAGQAGSTVHAGVSIWVCVCKYLCLRMEVHGILIACVRRGLVCMVVVSGQLPWIRTLQAA